ncbi:MAG: 5-dehydro-4-deoxy-D-glucuronate isomerase [Atribacterota bacterium]|nr:5-dehydro-4-deoxy-D-glucuronate isomerase [Atribacterota bacterium]
MEIRQAFNAQYIKSLTTEDLPKDMLISGLFIPGKQKMVYTHFDRMIVGGISPRQPLTIDDTRKLTGTDYLLESREMGIINIGSPGIIKVDGEDYVLDYKDLLYIGMGIRDIQFLSKNQEELAKFYFVCTTAHQTYPTKKIEFNMIQPISLGSTEGASKRVLYKYIVPETIQTSQLTMGMTAVEPGNVWCNIPGHTHARKTEVFLFCELKEEAIIVNIIGEPKETRHIITRNEEAIIAPGWSIHSGVGTSNYTLIWGMAGENQTFTDMDGIPFNDLQ